MGLLRSIFATPDTANSAVKAVISAGDKIWYTEEEKAEGRLKLNQWYLDYLKVTSGQHLARRIIAFLLVGLWTFLTLLAALVWPFSSEYSDFLFEVVRDSVMNPVNIIIGFYFLTHAVKNIKGK